MLKRKFLGLVLFFSLIFLISNVVPFFSVSKPNKVNHLPVTKKDIAKYTYISYICADNNLGSYGKSDVNEMETGYNDSVTDVHVISLLDLLSGGTTAYYISHDDQSGTITSTQLVIPGFLSEENLGDPNTLITYVNFCIAYYPAEHYILDLWDHGSGWAICFDETSGNDALTMAELRYALETINATTGNTIDILAMDACLMGTLEVAYEIRNFASILIASEDAVLAQGFPYDTIIDDICDDPNQTITECASTMVDLFHASQFSFFPSTLSAVNLSLVDTAIFPNFVPFAQNLHSYLNYGIKNELYNARTASESFYDPVYIDLYDFALNTKNEASNLTIRQLAQNLISNISISIINEKHYYNPGAYGLSIYFPSSQASYLSSYSTHFALSNDTMWDDFLIKYYTTANFGVGFRYYRINDSLGNNNNTPDPGETLMIDIELENVGEIEAGFLNGTLFCLDAENITIMDGFKSYGNLSISATGIKIFTFNISSNCTINQVLPFILMTEAIFEPYTITRNFTFEIVVGRKIILGGSSLQTATEIYIGYFYGNLPGPGVDGESWFKINCTKDFYLFLNLTGPALTDYDVYVYDPDEKLASVAGKPVYPDECSMLIMQSGFHYIKVLSYSGGYGYYDMFVNITTEAYEDGLSYGTAFTLSSNARTNGTLPGPGSTDYLYYRVIVSDGQRLQVTLEGEFGVDFDLYIYDTDLNELDRSNNFLTSSEYCVVKASSTGYYYIIIVRYFGSGEFTLEVTVDDFDLPPWLPIVLIILIALAVAFGVVFYFHNVRKSRNLPQTHPTISDVSDIHS
ncbi:MAG: hypothetical protein HWN66_12445 [Candidatus Helarchaeota archaeon]|nr:hypothetical protein [Candidatus Helarchaeota archaeon]